MAAGAGGSESGPGARAGAGDLPWLPLQRVRSEFQEMPGLRLTREQAARLCGLDAGASQRALDALVATGFLLRTEAGCYRRTSAV